MMASDKYVCNLKPELQKKALDELSEKPEWRDRDIQALRDLVKSHKGLTCPTDDAFLLRFLRARKFDYDRALQLIINYYTIRAENKDIIKELTPKAVKHILDSCVSIILPKKDKLGRAIFYLRPAKWDPDKFSLFEILRVNIMNLEMAIMVEENQINGMVLVINSSEMTWNHVKNFERGYAKIMMGIIQDAFPMRFKGMHVVNEPSFFSYLFAIIKPFMKEKLASRLNFYGSDLKLLEETFGKENLPEELGGELPPGDDLAKEWQTKMESKAAVFEELKNYKIELTHEITDKKSDENVNFLTGTYRKLNVD